MPATSHASKKNYLGSRNKNFLSTNGALSVTQAERKKICLAASSSLVEISTKEKSSLITEMFCHQRNDHRVMHYMSTYALVTPTQAYTPIMQAHEHLHALHKHLHLHEAA